MRCNLTDCNASFSIATLQIKHEFAVKLKPIAMVALNRVGLSRLMQTNICPVHVAHDCAHLKPVPCTVNSTGVKQYPSLAV